MMPEAVRGNAHEAPRLLIVLAAIPYIVLAAARAAAAAAAAPPARARARSRAAADAPDTMLLGRRAVMMPLMTLPALALAQTLQSKGVETPLILLLSTLVSKSAPIGASTAAPPPAAAADDPFARCGYDEAGIVGTGGGELNTPFGTHPYCCGNTTWSSFSWRAKASPNAPISSDLQPAGGSGRANASWCLKEGPARPASFDCFIFYMNASEDSAGGGAAAGYNGHNYTETRAAGQWTNWREFLPDAATLQHDGTMPATGGTVGAYHCYAYPNYYMDPIRHLVVPLTVQGVHRDNMSTITIEVQPGGAKSGQPTYQLNTTVSGLGNTRTLMSSIRVPLVVTRENLTHAEGGGLPLMTERDKHARLWSALPQIPRAPRKILIKQGFHGGNDMGDWQDAARALVGMGASAISAPPSAAVAQIFNAAGVTAAGLEGSLSPNYEMEYRSPVLNFSTDCGKATSDVDHCWGSTDAEVQENLKLWAEGLIAPMRSAGFEQLTQFALHDELGYNFDMVGVVGKTPNNITHNPRVLARFHRYLRNMSGLTTPQDFGARSGSWSDVVPMTRTNLTATVATARSAAQKQGLRVRYYWTMRFVAWDVETWYAKATAALVAANGEPFSIYTNWNNVRLPCVLCAPSLSLSLSLSRSLCSRSAAAAWPQQMALVDSLCH
jgi:hypothetical protein